MATDRTALLIGVAEAPGATSWFPPLTPSVEVDLKRMRVALEESRYDVRVVDGVGRAEIGTRIFETARDVPEGGTLLVYFTGHGVRIDGVDYLVPADARAPRDPKWTRPYLDSLLPADIGPYLEGCRAGTVLWLLDACRDEANSEDELFGQGRVAGQGIDWGVPADHFAVMIGCGIDERCGYTEDGSFFTRGLAQALSGMSVPRQVNEVYLEARAVTERLSRRYGSAAQHVQIRYGAGREDRTPGAEICEGSHLLENWRDAVVDQELWALGEPCDEKLAKRLRGCLLSLVEATASKARVGHAHFPDPWADDAFVPRLLSRLAQVAPGEARLSAVEVTVLAAAVLLREAAWAVLRSQAVDAHPMEPERLPRATPLRRYLEQVHDQHAHITDKLGRGGRRATDRESVASWLVNQWIAERFEIDDKPVPGEPATRFARNLLGPDEGRVEELSGVLTRLAAGIGAELPRDQPGGKSRKVWLPEGHQVLRESLLSALLRVAGALAVDVRVLPEVIAEHLAVSDHVEPKEVVALVRSLRWSADDEGWHMDLSCPHPAVHAALEELADRADRLVVRLRKPGEGPEAALLAGVPRRVTANEVRPRVLDGGQDAYEKPLLRFTLAQTEVRGLLMGKQLYGDSALAIRELYQNAMDACRYREMRWRFLRLTGRHPPEWRGRIVVEQGVDERGRYIECGDNGVGMGREQLTNTFTRAGSRFERSKSFRREQAEWLRADPDLLLYPNSRFGIGVFSYFMLADEMALVTRQVTPEGDSAPGALRVDIPGSGSLFRIQPHTGLGDRRGEGGTRVRLYLRDDPELETVSCVAVLRSLIKVSEFELEVREDDLEPVTWEAKKLHLSGVHGAEGQYEAVPGVLWWVNGEGAILCDGVATDKRPYGYVLNLTGEHAGTLSVSRNELQSYDEEWAKRIWREGARRLPEWSGFSMEWLWNVASNSSMVAREVWQELRGKDLRVPVRLSDEFRCDLDATGIFSYDRQLIGSVRHTYGGFVRSQLMPWRTAVLGNRPAHWMRNGALPDSLVGYPIPEPGDAALANEERWTWLSAVRNARGRATSVAEVVRSLRRLRIVHPKLAPPAAVPGDLDWSAGPVDDAIAEEMSRYTMDDLRGLVAASRRLSRPLGWLVEWCSRYDPLRREALPEVPPHHRRHVCTADESAMLFIGNETAHTRRLQRVEYPQDVQQVCAEHGFTPRDVLDCLARFRWLGWHPPEPSEVDKWVALDVDLANVLRVHQGKDELSWIAVAALAAKQDVALGKAERELVEVARGFGLRCARRWSESDTGDSVLSPEIRALVLQAHDYKLPVDHGFGLPELAEVLPQDADAETVERVVEELREVGIGVSDDVRLLTAWRDLPLRTKYVLTGTDSAAAVRLDTEAMTRSLFTAAVKLGESIGGVRELYRSTAVRFGLPEVALPEEIDDLRPTWHEEGALLLREDYDGYEFGDQTWASLTEKSLAQYASGTKLTAGAAYEQLARYRPLGAPVPDLAPAALAELRNTTVDERDLVALDGGHRLTAPDEPLVPLDLVSIAARLGEPVSRTWERIRPFLPLMPAPEISHVPDEIPRWQDLAILSRYLDGRLPAVEGVVDPGHVAFVAAEIDATPEWVVERLHRYAEMFGLDLSSPDLPAPDLPAPDLPAPDRTDPGQDG